MTESDIDFFNLPTEIQDRYHDKAAELLDGLHYCTRVWEGWQVGTMTRHDFINADEDDEIVSDIAEMLYKFVCQESREAIGAAMMKG